MDRPTTQKERESKALLLIDKINGLHELEDWNQWDAVFNNLGVPDIPDIEVTNFGPSTQSDECGTW